MGVNSLSFQQCATVLTSLVKQATGRDVVVRFAVYAAVSGK